MVEETENSMVKKPSFSNWTRRFREHVEGGRLELALESITEARYNDAFNLGDFFWGDKCPSIAEKIFGKLTEINESDWKPWQNRGILLSVLKRYEEALQCLERVTKLTPECATALCEMGRIHIYRQNMIKAKEFFRKARQIDPTFVKNYVKNHLGLERVGELWNQSTHLMYG